MLAFDEEVDYLEYQGYLRTQSDSDLCDILTHLDSVHCPRRAEAANRELLRRQLVTEYDYDDSENVWRKSLLCVIAFLSVTILLGIMMPANEAIQPQPPPSLDLSTTGQSYQFSSGGLDSGQQLTVAVFGVYIGQLAENALRDTVLFSSQCGIYLIIFCTTVWKLWFTLKERHLDNDLRTDVRRLLLFTVFTQILLIVSSAWNNLPILVNGGHEVDGGFVARAISILAPWG